MSSDFNKIIQVVQNLLSNAIKFAKKKITLKIYQHKANGPILIQVNKFVIKVIDDGVGISKELIEKL